MAKGKNNSGRMILILVLLIAIIILLVIFMIYLGTKGTEKTDPTNTPPYEVVTTPTPEAGPDETPENTEGSITDTPYITDTPTPTPVVTPVVTNTHTPTPTPTPTPTTKPTPTQGPTSAPTPTSSTENVYATGINVLEGSLMDYPSFMTGVSSDYFHDININDRYSSGKNKGKLCGSWWSGTEIKKDGVIVDVKRSAETEALLNRYEARYINRNAGKTIYLTFDCGYENGNTGKILDTLKAKNVKAIFFVTSQFIAENDAEALLHRMSDEGHLIGSHTYSHPNMALLTNDEFVTELRKNQERLNNKLPGYTMHYYRPPEGASSERDLALAREMGYRTVFWSFAYGDYNVNNQMDPEKALNNYLKAKIHPGAVYLLHAVSSTNAAILGDFIDYARSLGYEFARIDEW